MKKKLVILISIIIIIIFILLIALVLLKNNQENDNKEGTSNIENIQNDIIPISDNKKLFTIKDYIQKFIEQINLNNVIYYNGDKKIEQSMISELTYNYLSMEYINKNNIQKNNVFEFVKGLEEKLTFIPVKINMLECKDTTRYSVYGYTLNQNDEYKEDVYFIFNVDNVNNTYSIEPIYNVESIDEIILSDSDLTIENNKKNIYKENEINDEYICKQYLSFYKETILSRSKEAFNYLNQEYREKKFGTLKKFLDYVNDNKDIIRKIQLSFYSIKEKEYICCDQFNNYYIFNLKDALDYQVILDTYTVDLPEFIDKYNKSNDQEKVILNIGKVISAINNDDFKYFYNKLADSFKNNYFENEDALKNYWLDNLYKKNKVEFMDFNREGNLYTYKLKITKQYEEGEESTFGKDAPSSFINIVMQLKEGTDFVMSFSVLEQ